MKIDPWKFKPQWKELDQLMTKVLSAVELQEDTDEEGKKIYAFRIVDGGSVAKQLHEMIIAYPKVSAGVE